MTPAFYVMNFEFYYHTILPCVVLLYIPYDIFEFS